jgi:hypothetical protein
MGYIHSKLRTPLSADRAYKLQYLYFHTRTLWRFEMNDEPDESTELLEKDKYIQMIMEI